MYDIELATARLETTMAASKAAIIMVVDEPGNRNQHMAMAIKKLLDENQKTIEQQMQALEKAVRREYVNPANRPVSAANERKANELINLAKRFERHLNALESLPDKFTTMSISFMMLATPIINARSIEFLNGEALSRDPDDETAKAYHQAMREAAHHSDVERIAIERMETEGQLMNQRATRMLAEAKTALDTIDRLVPPEDRLMPPDPLKHPADHTVHRISPQDADEMSERPTATRFHDWLVRQLKNNPSASLGNPWHLEMLESTDTKRILFDSLQATLFRDLAMRPPENIQRNLRTPFETFYIEPTSPIWMDIGMAEKRFISLRGMLVNPHTEGPSPDEHMEQPFYVTAWLTDNVYGVSTASFVYDLSNGRSYAPAEALRYEDPDDATIGSTIPDHIPDDQLLPLGPDEDRGPMGSVEEIMWQTAQLLSWICCYTMAKSIKIVQEPLSRQRRNLLARRGIPNPWHVVRVDPRITERETPLDIEPGDGPRIRFDVIGHLRFGQHRRRDGTYSETIEWVRPHQHGLANELYVPKISRISGDRQIHPKMEQYWGTSDLPTC